MDRIEKDISNHADLPFPINTFVRIHEVKSITIGISDEESLDELDS